MSALVIAALYLGLIELVLLDSSTRLRTAQQFRARVVAGILAENGAELAAQNMVNASSTRAEAELTEGALSGQFERTGDAFVLRGNGRAGGVHESSAQIVIHGRIDGGRVWIDSAQQVP